MKMPRLRIFAGPNGSGKSTLNTIINPALLGIYINPDEIEKQIILHKYFDFESFSIQTTPTEITGFLMNSILLKKAGLVAQVSALEFVDNKIEFKKVMVNSYFAAVIADFIRQKLVETQTSFSFETVMSSSDKIDFLKKAQQKGFRTYLYYVATKAPSINVSRVKNRVKMGGHSVPEDKIISRYRRSLDLLVDAVKSSNRAYIFDNSDSQGHVLLAEITNGKQIEMKVDLMPDWFKTAFWDKF